MRVLLIYEEVPEQITFHDIDDPSTELYGLLEDCNGKMINCDKQTPKMQILSDALMKEEEHCSNPKHHLACTLTNGTELPPRGSFDRVFLFSFGC